MMVYRLKCAQGHLYDEWFRSSAEYDEMKEAGTLVCKECGDTNVVKAIMAPSVAGAKVSEPAPAPAGGMCGMGGCAGGMCGLPG